MTQVNTYYSATRRSTAVEQLRCTSLVRAVRGETRVGGVKGHLVEGHPVDTFDDIDFTLTGPVLTLGPECGPNLNRGRVRASPDGDEE